MIRGMDLLVIDEISMVRADVLDAVDDVLRRYRDRSLPSAVSSCFLSVTSSSSPVVTEAEREILASSYASPYFFDSHALQQIDYETVVLDRVYRQNDMEFPRTSQRHTGKPRRHRRARPSELTLRQRVRSRRRRGIHSALPLIITRLSDSTASGWRRCGRNP